MKQSDEIRITRWIEGELDDAAVQDLLQSDPELYELRQSAHELGDLLRQELPPRELPYADFFNHQVLRRIEQEEPEPGTSQIVIRVPRLLASLFGNQGLIPGLAFAAVLLLGIGTFLFGGSAGSRYSEVVHAFAPDPGTTVSATTKAGASVISIEGIEPLEKDASVFAFHHQPGQAPEAVMHRQPLELAHLSANLVEDPFRQPLMSIQ